MVSLHGANRAPEVNMLPPLALITLLSKGVVGLNKVVFPTILAGALKAFEGLGREVSPSSSTPTIIVGRALQSNQGNS